MGFKVSFFLLTYSLICFFCCGQQIRFIPFHKYTQDNGISSYNITKIIQDSKGFIWIGTQEGLNHFDGKDFNVIDKEKEHGKLILGSNVSDMFEDEGVLWVATSYGGIVSINLSNLKVVNKIENFEKINLTEKWLRCITKCDNILWVGTSTGVYAFDLKKKMLILPKSQEGKAFVNVNVSVSKIFCDRFKKIWAFSDKNIYLINGKSGDIVDTVSLKTLNFENNPKSFNVWGLCKNDSEVYAATTWGLRKFNYTARKASINKWNESLGFLRKEIFDCIIDKSEKLWIACSDNLVCYDLKNNHLEQVRDIESKLDGWQTAVFSICNDNDNNIWLGSQEGLAFLKNKEGPFRSFYKSIINELKVQHAYTLSWENKTTVYCGTADGFYDINTKTRAIKKIMAGTTFYLVYNLPDRNILISCDQGLYVCRRELIEKAANVYPELGKVDKDLLNSAITYNDSLIFLGSHLQKGLYKWNFRSKKIVLEKISEQLDIADLSNRTINGIYKAVNNNIWIISDNFIAKFNPATEKTTPFQFIDPKSKLAANILYNMCESDSSFWITAYGLGVIETDKSMRVKRIITLEDGLNNVGVNRVFPVGDSAILITTNNGVSCFNYKTNNITNYYKSDGLNSSAFETFCGFQKDGKIYAGGLNGFTIIDPKYFTTNTTPPKLYFTNVKTQTDNITLDTSDLEIKQLKIPSNWLQTNVSFVGLNYSNPERVTYQYRIKQRGNKWSEASTQNFVSLMGLPPGTYTLEVKAANEDGVWSAPKQLTLIFQPKWYQTLWFDFAVALAVLGLFYAFYRYRIRQIQKQQQIRVDIAGDLHDDIGSALNTVKVFTHLAKRDVDKEEHLNQIEESLTQATTGLRDMIWILDDTQDTLQEIVERIKKFALPVAMAHGITLHCINLADKSEQAVSKTKKRNLMLIAKEAINNSIKYSECKNLQVVISQTNKKVSLIIKDDGKGFNKLTSPKGNGLGNIQHRAKQINAVAEIISAEGEGTIIKVAQK